MPEKNIYPTQKQEEILKEATDFINARYSEDSSILAIYLGGSMVDGTFGEYIEPAHMDSEPRLGSDIDVMLVTKNRYGPVLLSEKEQEQYGVRHIGKTKEIPVYRLIDDKNKDIFLHVKHPIEPMIVTKDLFEGWLSGKYVWGNEQSRPFTELVKEFRTLKENDELRDIRKKYTD